MSNIMNGQAISIYMGIHHDDLINACTISTTTEPEKNAMSHAAAMMLTGKCTEQEWQQGMEAYHQVNSRRCRAWEQQHGEPLRKKNGQIYGGIHPALNQAHYDQALLDRQHGHR